MSDTETNHQHGWICDYNTTDRIRPATPEEREEMCPVTGTLAVSDYPGTVYIED